jgi:protein-L-isoaspartate(D-aspartate) O-methyltransferase
MSRTALAPAPNTAGHHSIVARKAMVDSQLRPNDVIDPALVDALRKTPRERYLPVVLQASAYIDRALPLGNSRALNPVLTTARLIADARVSAGYSVLLIGGATGYAAAILAALGAAVTSVESDPALSGLAHAALAGAKGVKLVDGPLAYGAPDGAPYDALIVDGAIENLPVRLLNQLNPGARIVCGLIDGAVTRLARAVAVGENRAVRPLPFADLECVHLPGFTPPPRFTF